MRVRRAHARRAGNDYPLLVLVVAGLIAVVTIAVFAPAAGFDFLTLDDVKYVTENEAIQEGLSVEAVRWALTTGHAANWHPVTWVSHLVDYSLFGANPSGHHMTSVVLHGINAGLLLLVLWTMTGRLWPSAFVAACFALHPLRVESVAWIAERKDVLSAFFGLLATWMYVAYARRGGTVRYLLAAGLFALGLMAKPMLVTLPFVLLLLDYWPLGRWNGVSELDDKAGANRPVSLLIEKLPFLALSVFSSVATWLAQRSGGTVVSEGAVELHLRLANAVVSYVRYIILWIVPRDLALFYPHPNLPGGVPWAWWQVTGSGLLLVAITWLAWRRRYAIVGWLWYLGTLVPVIGLVQVGPQALADRYTYLPLIGLSIVVVWGGAEILESLGPGRSGARVVAVGGCVLLLLWAVATSRQLQHWRNSVALFQRAVEVSPKHPIPHNYLGVALETAGRTEESVEPFRRAIELNPRYAAGHFNLANSYSALGRKDAALPHYEQALALQPDHADAEMNLANALLALGRFDDAVEHYERALELRPNHADTLFNLAVAFHTHGRIDEAIETYRRTIETDPRHAPAHNNLGLALERSGDTDAAIGFFREALSIDPGYTTASENLRRASAARSRKPEPDERTIDNGAMPQ